MKPIRFTVPGTPVSQPRHRIAVRNGHARAFEAKQSHPIHVFKSAVRTAATEAYTGTPLSGPLRVDITFVLPRPKSKVWKSRPMPRYWHTGKPDRDNLDKAVLDSLAQTILSDDKCVCAGEILKYHAAGDEQPHVEITITAIET